ncbi:DNA-3-methyladenine glycosylase 2 family protein [Thalassobaculum sp. OXR-137]|uniref:DNA-3-methyladenine glycosylase family protein n=1 Tax=Thalassobaculum sp. OXR-137 TaxID=3100173 RepID=UPI002AC8B9E3|nr:DNA-3-methyladenine glycosylase 2 family protein [Thalassobaculum sp. OXR-137]WPZ32459.1 DNA-3-methyladenine glycosylase 2 family protein [Thalassobaculum sp. OXR-137]
MTRQKALDDGLRALADRDPDVAAALAEAGAPEPRVLEPGFAALIRIIVGQQVSTASAAAILARLAAAGGLDAETFAAFDDAQLGAIGFSRAKMRYGRALAERVLDGRLPLERLSGEASEAAHAALVAVPGIGRWTAEIYRMFALGDPDVFPSGDVALREGIRMLRGSETRPDIAGSDAVSADWAPHRSAAAHLLWRLYRVRRGVAVLGADR